MFCVLLSDLDKSSCLREEKVERKERRKCQVHDTKDGPSQVINKITEEIRDLALESGAEIPHDKDLQKVCGVLVFHHC